ncbi:DUF2911 domain-containing protein [Haliscomenobacter hydrossis]|uniref:DUF2911 domain-containing protein n=1 Tax=Haliscomenobacter hydrossis (strain ATCC 27775 / DSM 1100 / LMG 10767 / O) TaxID=760192 RepID=F4KPP0_HALH1|nr:DUF2911 domain-containing protein [Haliscomenobacter hydrossis]AEE50978.1 hypothetical protein Halhy_3116 [Haliscomenobacter hydrossis DSM 1100]
MKKIFLLLSLSILGFTAAQAQDKPRVSPPAEATATVKGKKITISYGQPSVKGREIWGKLVPYGQVWRTGANESTSIEFSEDVMVQGKPVPKGKYALFTIPNEKEWTIIINKSIKWGAYTYKEDEDVLRVMAPVKKAKAFTEQMAFAVSKKGVVSLMWENVQVDFKVK